MTVTSGMTTGGISGPLYISEYADAAGTGNYIFEFVEIHNFGTAVYDAGSYKLQQEYSSVIFILSPSIIIPAKGFLVIGRDAFIDDFEMFWGVTLGSQVVYVNSGDKIPLINGSEIYRLVDASDAAVDPEDGSYSAMAMSSSAGKRIYRLSTGNSLSDWAVTNWDLATPGRLDEDQSLPVTLSFFTAKAMKGNVVLEWETSAEIENQGFILSREYRGASIEVDSDHIVGTGQVRSIIADFTSHNALKGQGTTTETTKYSFVDKTVEPEKTYVYTLADVDYEGRETRLAEVEVKVKIKVKVEVEGAIIADGYTLDPAYPNPFNAQFTLPFTLSKSMNITVELYSLTGKNLMTVVNREHRAGSHTYTVNTDDLSSGMYLVRTAFNDHPYMQKVVLLK
jgi:hypothetical protein